jgi:DNA-binding transcriptional LysR family regulator
MAQQTVDAFRAVIDHGGFRPAAIALGVSQPAVTRRIQRLEHDLEVRFRERHPGGCTRQVTARRSVLDASGFERRRTSSRA